MTRSSGTIGRAGGREAGAARRARGARRALPRRAAGAAPAAAGGDGGARAVRGRGQGNDRDAPTGRRAAARPEILDIGHELTSDIPGSNRRARAATRSGRWSSDNPGRCGAGGRAGSCRSGPGRSTRSAGRPNWSSSASSSSAAGRPAAGPSTRHCTRRPRPPSSVLWSDERVVPAPEQRPVDVDRPLRRKVELVQLRLQAPTGSTYWRVVACS